MELLRAAVEVFFLMLVEEGGGADLGTDRDGCERTGERGKLRLNLITKVNNVIVLDLLWLEQTFFILYIQEF